MVGLNGNNRIINIANNYWIARRNASVTDTEAMFGILAIAQNGNLDTFWIWDYQDLSYGAGESGAVVETPSKMSMGLRPIFILKSGIHYVEENGTKVLVK